MIRSFSDAATEDLYHGRQTSRVRRFPPTIITIALRKLDVLSAAHELVDLRMPPGNRLEALKGDMEVFTVSGSMSSGGLYSAGRTAAQTRLPLRITINRFSLLEVYRAP